MIARVLNLWLAFTLIVYLPSTCISLHLSSVNCFTSFTFLFSVSVLHFFDPLSAFVFYRGCFFKVVQRLLHCASRTRGPAAVAAIPPVIGELNVTPQFRGKTTCYRTLLRIDLNLIIMTIIIYDPNLRIFSSSRYYDEESYDRIFVYD